MTNWPKIWLLEHRLHWHRKLLKDDLPPLHKHETAEQTAKYWQHFHEAHHELDHARANGRQVAKEHERVKLWKAACESHSAEIHRLEAALRALKPVPKPLVPGGEGWYVPQTAWNPYRRKVANWIGREIEDAVHNHGAQGFVTSGVRTYAEQAYLYWLSKHGGNIAAPPGSSNHEGWNYHEDHGAVDWSQPQSLNLALSRKPSHKLLWAETHGLADYPHFSATGH